MMTGKNNHHFSDQRIQHYGLRKLSIGVASVLLSTAIYLGVAQENGFADTLDNHAVAESQSVPNSESTKPADQVPTAEHDVKDQLTNENVSNVQVERVQGQTDQNGIPAAGSTKLSFEFNLSNEQVKQLKAGDYFDIQMGVPYTVTATGQTKRLSYGQVVKQSTPIKVWSHQGHLIGYVVPMDADNAYLGSQSQANTGTISSQWTEVMKHNEDAVKQLGATNGYYRLIFVDDINKYGAVSTKISALNWYNAFVNEDSTKAPTDTDSFTLYSPDNNISEYQPKDDIQIGSATATSGLSLKVTHGDRSATLNRADELGANTSTKTAAHWWYQRDDGTWVLGYNSLNDPAQSEGVSLDHSVGNDFDLTVTKPADSDKVEYFFADDDQVQKDLKRTIVGTSETQSADPLVDNEKIAVGSETVITKPQVTVTSTQNGNTKTYHVHIDGDYLGFRHDSNGTRSYASTITLLSWKPKDAFDLLPPADAGISNYDSDDSNAIAKKYPNYHHVAGVLVDDGLIKELQNHPWQVQVTDQQGKKIKLTNVGEDGQAGYFFMKNPQTILHAPNNYGIAVGQRPTFNQGVAKQIIHYWYDQVGGKSAANDTVRTVTFVSSDNGATWYNGTSPENNHFQEGQFYDVDVPAIDGYTAYQVGDLKTPITKAGFQGYFTYGDPKNASDYTRQVTYDQDEKALVINVVYQGKPQHLYYQVVLEDANGNYNSTLVQRTLLETGKSDADISNATQQKWHNLLQKYQQYIDSGSHVRYAIVDHNSSDTKLKKTDQLPASFDHDSSVDQIVTIYLAPAPKMSSVTVHYIDVDHAVRNNPGKTNFVPMDGKEVHSEGPLTGESGTNYIVTSLWDYQANHYELATELDSRAQSGMYSDNDQDIYVYLKHQVTPLSQRNTVTETVHYLYANGPLQGQKAAPDQVRQVSFTQQGTRDEVTKEESWDDWQPSRKTIAAIKSPLIDGYVADQEVVPAVDVGHDTLNFERTVKYTQQVVPAPHPDIPNPGSDEPKTDPKVDDPQSVKPMPTSQVPQEVVQSEEKNQKASRENQTTRAEKLPQTGQDGLGLMSLGLITMMSTLGLLIRNQDRRKNN